MGIFSSKKDSPQKDSGVGGTSTSTPPFSGYSQGKPPDVVVVDIAGREGSGKTHMALTSTKPAICDTERKAFRILDKGIGNASKHFSPSDWNDVVAFTEHVLKDSEVETVVFDTLKELEEMAHRDTLEELSRDRGKKVDSLYSRDAGAVQYKYVNERIENLIKRLRVVGKSVIFTSRMKDEYVDNQKTGRLIRDGWNKMPYYADFCVQAVETIPGVHIDTLKPGVMIWKVMKNGSIVRGLYRPYIVAKDFQDLLQQLRTTEADVEKYLETLKDQIQKP
jgi:hypothetical protein